MTEVEQIVELRKALESLVKLHRDWDKGTAYVTVQFMRDNNAAIAAARGILAKTVAATPSAANAREDAENASITPVAAAAVRELTPVANQDNKPGAARDDKLLELLQLHRTAVHQSDTYISDQFERRLREYREQLLAGSQKECPLTPEAILDYAGMHGLIPLRRQQWPASQVFNQKLIALVLSALSAATRAGVDAPLVTPVSVQALTDGLRSGLRVCDELLHRANTPDRDLVQRARGTIESAMLALLAAPAAPASEPAKWQAKESTTGDAAWFDIPTERGKKCAGTIPFVRYTRTRHPLRRRWMQTPLPARRSTSGLRPERCRRWRGTFALSSLTAFGALANTRAARRGRMR